MFANSQRDRPIAFTDGGIPMRASQIRSWLLKKSKLPTWTVWIRAIATPEQALPDVLRTGVHLEGTSKALDSWAYENGVTLDVSRPGKPTDNALGETFNDSLRDECLNVRWFLWLADARAMI